MRRNLKSSQQLSPPTWEIHPREKISSRSDLKTRKERSRNWGEGPTSRGKEVLHYRYFLLGRGGNGTPVHQQGHKEKKIHIIKK